MSGVRPPRHRPGTLLGVPLPVVLAALVISGLLGVQLAGALQESTAGSGRSAAASVDSVDGAGKNSAGLPVVTETTLGTEVQRLVDSGSIQPLTTFDAPGCLQRLGVHDSILIMEEVAWGGDETPSWLLVHGPTDRETLQAAGGIISATVVLPGCGETTFGADAPATEDLIWSGDVMIGSL
ncbi:hypothetical protein [Brachybacterium sp. Marseille-Q7125]|uniref:hypothetical protein n=1 Tax=Brachybacterium sp. Marseille-Q7125 TaxID=2932815 RepID=UPI001FF41E5B|nr:hypothetical protein [Brachybacterium sp. Marseille-Q7125]